MEKEERRLTVTELRTTVDIERKPIIEGHAAVFNQPSVEIFRDAPGWREIIRPGAFKDAIQTDDVVALFNHDNSGLIGRRSNNTLTLEEDEIGLKVRIFPPNTQLGNDVLELIRRKDLTQMSFGFSLSADGSGERRDHQNKFREILKVQTLYDVSPVTLPAYRQTDVGLRVDPDFRSRLETDLKPVVDFQQIVTEFLADSKARSEARRKLISTLDSSKRRFVYVSQR